MSVTDCSRKILAIIPARGGSKGIPRKNVVRLNGRPLIAWSILAARESGCLDRIVVSTDDEEIAAISRECGADVPFHRPPELAQDNTPGVDPVIHAIQWLEAHEEYRPEYVLLLQPTSPLRTAGDIAGVVEMARTTGADTVLGICAAKVHPFSTLRLAENGQLTGFLSSDWREQQRRYPRRQDLPEAHVENGALYLTRRKVILETRTFYGEKMYGYVMPEERSIDIDTPLDLWIAERSLSLRRQS